MDEIGERKSGVDCTGLTGSARAYFVYRMYLRDPRPMVVVLPKAPDAERFMADLEFFTGGLSWPVVYFPPYHILPFKFLSYHGETASARIRALFEMMEYSLSAPPLVVTTAGAMAQKVMPKSVLSEHCELLAENEDIEIDRLAEKLNAGGYERSMIVEEPGDYCVRGGIVDIFSPLYENPIRIELFGDMVESLRFFSPVNQRTLKRVSEAVIAPCRETVLVQSELAEIASRVRAQGARMELPVSQVREIVDRVKNEGVFPGIEILLPMMYSQMDTFMDYAPERSLYVLMEPRDLQKASDDVYEQARNNYAASLQDKSFGIEPESLFLPWEKLEVALEKERPVRVKSLAMVRPDEEGEVSFRASFATSDNSELQGQLKARKDSERLFIPLAQWLEEKTSAGMNALVVCASKSRAQRADTILKPYGVATELLEGFDPRRLSKNRAAGRAYLCIGGLASGFVWPEESLAFITDVEIFGKRRRRKPAAPKVRTGLLSFDELQQDDLVVHAEHGIGQYHGLVKLELNGTGNEFLLLQYRDNDKLYLPVDRMNLIQKYMGVEGVVPVLDKMGGKSWERVRSKVKKSVEKIAAELLRLYASRKVREGWAFSDLTEEMREFEAAFPFEETPDQLKAIEDVFSDMTAPTPMDRLICGDVGYGKTEVALRASFLSAFNGKQVAMLVPTTVLAEQHFATFSKRFEPYPVTVACLSRFRPARQQKEIVEGLKSGAVDIVIGTHRLVQKDVGFKDLGLLILDEEQRFGVKHKEKIKKIKSTVDVLALSATPIPSDPAHVAGGNPGHQRAFHAARVPQGHRDLHFRIRRRHRQGRHKKGGCAGGADFLRPQQHLQHRLHGATVAGAGPRGSARGGPRQAGGVQAGKGHAVFHGARAGHAALHHHHRVRAGRGHGQHDHRQSRGPIRPVSDLPVAGQGGALRRAGVRVPVRAQGEQADQGRRQAPEGAHGAQRPGSGVSDRHERSEDPRRGHDSGSVPVGDISRRWATTCSCSSWSRPWPSRRAKRSKTPWSRRSTSPSPRICRKRTSRTSTSAWPPIAGWPA